VRHVVVGTAGHVDHGKTALVHALTGVMTDRLPEEQRRGITIELGFAPWRISDDLLVSIIDAPGHRKLVHHMIAGASGIDLVLLVVAADEGVMPQTREHIAACRLLGVRQALVAVTKVDRVDRELAELAAEEALALLGEHGIEARAVLCSSKTGEGVEALREAMRGAIDVAGPARERGRRVRLSVDRVFTVKGSGTVVTGTLVEGKLQLGAPLRVLGADHERASMARSLHVHGESRETVAAPTRLAINLGGLALDQVERGDVVTDDAHALPTRAIDVWLQSLEPLRRGFVGSIFVGTARSTARLQPIEKADAFSGAGLVRLRLSSPLVVLGGDRFVLRGAHVDGPVGAVVGGGRVLDARPPRHLRAAKRLELLGALERGDAAEAILLLAAEHSPRPLYKKTLPSRLSVGMEALERAAQQAVSDRELIAVGRVGWLAVDALERLRARTLELVAEHHERAPLEPGIGLQTLRERVAQIGGEDATAEVIGRMTTGKTPALVIEGDRARLPAFTGAAGHAEAGRALTHAKAVLAEAALTGISEHTFAERVQVDAKQARALLAALSRADAAVHAGDLWFDAGAVNGLRARVLAHFEREEVLTIQQFKDMTGLGRKQTIPLLEHLDRTKVTRRKGSDRVKG
jgi:selenocysteine-specific elongation factor